MLRITNGLSDLLADCDTARKVDKLDRGMLHKIVGLLILDMNSLDSVGGHASLPQRLNKDVCALRRLWRLLQQDRVARQERRNDVVDCSEVRVVPSSNQKHRAQGLLALIALDNARHMLNHIVLEAFLRDRDHVIRSLQDALDFAMAVADRAAHLRCDGSRDLVLFLLKELAKLLHNGNTLGNRHLLPLCKGEDRFLHGVINLVLRQGRHLKQEFLGAG